MGVPVCLCARVCVCVCVCRCVCGVDCGQAREGRLAPIAAGQEGEACAGQGRPTRGGQRGRAASPADERRQRRVFRREEGRGCTGRREPSVRRDRVVTQMVARRNRGRRGVFVQRQPLRRSRTAVSEAGRREIV